jgi:hypothetical protein
VAGILTDTALHQEQREHITVVVAAQAVILTQVLVVLDIKALLLYDTETSKGKIWQRYKI